MDVLAPCKLGEQLTYSGKKYILTGVSWFYWTNRGYDFTYDLIRENSKQQNVVIVGINDKNCPECKVQYQIDDMLTKDGSFKGHGYPLKGTGYVHGLNLKEGTLYADVILSSKYQLHIEIPCTETGKWIPGSKIWYPPIPSFDTEEKRQDILLKKELRRTNNDKDSE